MPNEFENILLFCHSETGCGSISAIKKQKKGRQTMAELKGSKTEKNLETAFAGESMARNKYTYFASKARKEGYVQILSLIHI